MRNRLIIWILVTLVIGIGLLMVRDDQFVSRPQGPSAMNINLDNSRWDEIDFQRFSEGIFSMVYPNKSKEALTVRFSRGHRELLTVGLFLQGFDDDAIEIDMMSIEIDSEGRFILNDEEMPSWQLAEERLQLYGESARLTASEPVITADFGSDISVSEAVTLLRSFERAKCNNVSLVNRKHYRYFLKIAILQ